MNNKQLFETYIEQNLSSAYRFAYSYAKNKEDAEDIVSESVEKALRSIHSLKNPRAMKPWFYRIIANTAISLLRKRSQVVQLDFEDLAESIGSEDTYETMNLQELFESMDYRYKSVLVLRFFEDMTLKETAEVLQLSENTVKTRYYKALRLLKADLEASYEQA